MKTTILVVAILAALVRPAPAQTTFTPDAEGFIRNWLVLAPIRMLGEVGVEEMHFDLLGDEAGVKPRPDATATVAGESMTWASHQTKDYFIDFRESFDRDKGEHAIGYAVAYIHADAPMDVTLALGTNDQGKAWLNGTPVINHEEARVLGKDDNKVPVHLVQGRNVLVLKVINEVNSWQACARFLDGTTPVTNIRIGLTPE